MTLDNQKKVKQEISPQAKEKKKYVPPDFEDESVFETLAAGCTFQVAVNPACRNGKVGTS